MPQFLKLISESERQRVSEAVRKAEEKTSGEIVPMIVMRSSVVGHVPVILFLILTGLSLALSVPSSLANYFELVGTSSLQAQLLSAGSVIVMLVLFGWISVQLSKIRSVQRIFTSKRDQNFQVEERAVLEFHQHHLVQTQSRTAVLIFISLMEQRAVILGDKAISEKLPPGTWDSILSEMILDIKKGQAGLGLTRAVERCGEILSQHFPIQAGDKNEICNQLIIKE
jgi:putative membrane protein